MKQQVNSISWNLKQEPKIETNYNPEESTYTCPKCRQTFNENELLEVTLLDYITDLFITYKGEKEND